MIRLRPTRSLARLRPGLRSRERYDAGRWSFELDSIAAIPSASTRLLAEIDKRLGKADAVVTYNALAWSTAVSLAAIRKRNFNAAHVARAGDGARTGCVDLPEMLFPGACRQPPPLTAVLRVADVAIPSTDLDPIALRRADDITGLRAAMLGDPVTTLSLFWLVQAFAAADEALATRPLAALARHVEASSAMAYLKPLATSDLAGWARTRAMRADAADALARIEARIGTADAERLFVPPRAG